MKKFVCAHCRHRLAVSPRHYGKLLTCPECGRVTHPLAEQILASAERSEPAPPSARSNAVACENCGRAIGNLQKRLTWEKKVVCADCHQALVEESARSKAARTAEKIPGSRDRPLKVQVARARTAEPPAARSTAETSTVTAMIVSAGSAILPVVTRRAGGSLAPLAWRYRALVLLGVTCLLGAALYGALTLLRDLTGVLTSLAAVLMAAAVLYFLLRAGWAAGKRAVAKRAGGISEIRRAE